MLGERFGEYPMDYLRKYLERQVRGDYHSANPLGFNPSREFGRVVEDIRITQILQQERINWDKLLQGAMTSLGLICRDQKPSARNLEFKRDLNDDSPSIRIIYTNSPQISECIITVWDREAH